MGTALAKILVTVLGLDPERGDCPVRNLETALGSSRCVVTAVSRVNLIRSKIQTSIQLPKLLSIGIKIALNLKTLPKMLLMLLLSM